MKLFAATLLSCLLLLAASPHSPGGVARSERAKRVYLRVVTYNIHVGIGMDKELDLPRIARVISAERPDLVALQELDRGVRRTKGADEVAELARLLRMEYAFAPNLDFQGGKYGVAILSRFPILTIDHRIYAARRASERRGMLRVEVMADGLKINFVTTHLDHQLADERLFQTEQLIKALSDAKGPLIVAGDFNDEPTGMAYRLMLNGFTDAWRQAMKSPDGGLTFPSDQPARRIDYVFVGEGVTVRGAAVRPTTASDHLPLVADLLVAWP